MKSALPNRIGRYEIVDRLGSGGMGVVYLATDPALGRTVAIKMLTEDNEELRERFAREARSAAALSHNNIVTIYDVGEDDGRPFIAMEFLDGETLAEMIRRRASVPIGRKLQLMLDLCTGLGYAHRNGIVHRDIKPANLMITSEGTLKILDFGIARVTSEATSAGLTRVGTLMGSPHYMSPEQAAGQRLDERSDIFSVGLVLYELLTLQRAFPGDNSHVVLNMILTAEPRAMREWDPAIDPELERTVNRALIKKPDERYQTLAEMAADLARIHERLQDGTEDPIRLVARRRNKSGASDGSNTPGTGSTPASGATPTGTPRNIPNLEAIANRRKEQIESYLREASAHFEAGRFEEAIAQCEHAVVLDPDETRALEMLHNAHRALQSRKVRQWLDEAKDLAERGSLTEAERLVGQSLELQPDSVEAQASLQDLKERRRQQERAAERARAARSAVARGRTNMESGAFEAALRCAAEALAFDPANEDARRLTKEAGEAVAERDRQQEHARRAAEVVSYAKRRESAGDIEDALDALRAFSPPHQLITQALAALQPKADALVREREEAERQRVAAEQALRREEEARVAEETRRREREAELARAAELGAAEAARRAERKRTTPDQIPWYRTPAAFISTGVLVVTVAVGGWWIWGRPPVAEPKPPQPVTAPKPVDYAPVLAEARTREADAVAAIALIDKIPAEAAQYSAAQDLLKRILTTAAERAGSARKEAEKAGAQEQAAFQTGDRQLKDAAGLQNARGAILLYVQARESFLQAATAGLLPEQLVQLARELFRNKRTTEAIGHAVSALTKDPGSESAKTFLQQRRSEARQSAVDARRRAAGAGASLLNSPKFKEGDNQEKAANNLDSPLRTQMAVDTYRDAQLAYEAAYSKIHDDRVALDAEVKTITQRFDRAMNAEDLPAAQTELRNLRSKDPNNQHLSNWDKRVKDLDRKLEEARSAATKKIEVPNPAKPTPTPTPAVTPTATPTRGTGPVTDPPPPPRSAEAAVQDVLQALATAYSNKNIGDIRKLWPSVPRDYDRDWNLNKSQQWILEDAKINITGTEATATCRVIMKSSTTRGPAEHKPVIVIKLTRQASGWQIQSLNSTTTWK